jgi:hypothetical protein
MLAVTSPASGATSQRRFQNTGGIRVFAGISFFIKMPREAFTREPPLEILRGKPEWYGPYLRATWRYWDELSAQGPRFAREPMASRDEFTGLVSTIAHVLGDLGVVKSWADMDTPGKIFEGVHRALTSIDSAPSS